ncbi:MAG: prepilin peptidase [Anaerolineales bacterium]|nr:prepilin peptidase [Anaerolineales bacterium]
MTTPQTQLFEWAVRIAFTGLLVSLAAYDWRYRRVPNGVVQPLLLGSVVLLILRLGWGYLSPAALAVAGGTWAACLILWWLHVFGGGDMKLVIAVIALAPELQLVYLLLAAVLGGLLLNLALGEGPSGLRRLAALLVTASQGALPTRAEITAAYEARGRPITFAFCLAGIVYLWLFWAGL